MFGYKKKMTLHMTMPMSKSKDILPDSNSWRKYNFDLEVINVRDKLYHGDTLTCQTKYDYVKGQKSLVLNTKQCHKHYKFDLEVKIQGCIRIMNVLDTSSHGDQSAKFDMPMSKLTEVEES